MASFNISKGLEASLPSTKTDGKMYFCTDTGNIYIDYKDGNNILRKLVNKQILDAKQDAITGAASTIANSNLTANRVLLSNSSGKIAASAVTDMELSYLDGVTSAIQTQLDNKIPFDNTNYTSLSSGDDLNNFKTPGIYISTNSTTTSGIINAPITGSGFKLFVIDGYINGRVSQFVTTNNNNLHYRQFNGTSWGDWDTLATRAGLDKKQATVTGAATTITSSDLTANRALVSNSSGKVAASAITSTELSYLDGVTSNIQTQLDGKLAKTAGYAGSSSAGGSATSAVKLDSSAGSATQPVYFSGGKPVATTYTLGKSVPSNAKFTDTTYSAAGSSLGLVKSGGDVTISSGVITVKDDSHSHVISNIDELQTALDNKQNKYGNRHIITVEGKANKYYPVLITNLGQESYAWSHLHISRGYAWPAPDTWNTATHRGGLTLSIRWSGDTGWGGNDHVIEVEEFAENYTTMVGGLTLSVSGLVVWLRGGTAQYAFQTDYGNSINITVNLGTYTAADGKEYAVKTTPDTAGVKTFWYNRHGTYVGNATTATALTSKSIGSATNPVYFDANGKPVKTTYTLGKSVPSDAKFTDTTYSNFVKSGSGAKAGLVPAPSTTAGTTKYLREDGTWAVPPDKNTTYTFNGAVSTIKDSNLTASRALISNSSGKVAASAITSTELSYLDGVTSNIQTQLDDKAPSSHTHTEYMTSNNPTGTGSFSLNRKAGTTIGSNSFAAGENVTSSGITTIAFGRNTTASGLYSFAEGDGTTASAWGSHAEGKSTKASQYYSHAEGKETVASGDSSHAEGANTEASGSASHAEGKNTMATGTASHAAGYHTQAKNYQYVIGKWNNASTAAITSMTDTTATAGLFIVGIGTSNIARANGFRINPAGNAYGVGAFGTSGADYAEYFEWVDGNPNNEDRRGRFVTLDGNKIRYATTEDDYVLGIISAEPTVVGDIQSEMWHNMYLKDIYGNKLVEVVEVEESIDENDKIIPAHTERRWVLNPDYDSEMEYISREERPEWDAVGIVGKLVAVDDGTCQVNSYCYPSIDGVATASKEKTAYRVIERLDDTHIRIFIK